MESVGQNLTFSEHGHVAYQMKENHECRNMVANILPADTPNMFFKGYPLEAKTAPKNLN